MLIIGAGGLAKEILEILSSEKKISEDEIYFFDDLNKKAPDKVFETFHVIKTLDKTKQHFQLNGKEFVLGLGNPARIIKHHD